MSDSELEFGESHTQEDPCGLEYSVRSGGEPGAERPETQSNADGAD